MGFTKEYDEIADRYLLTSQQHTISEQKVGSAKFGLYVSCQYVDLKDGGDTLWIIAVRVHTDWHWVGNAGGILLVGDERFPFEAEVPVADSFWSEATFLNEPELQIVEEAHIGCDPEVLAIIGKSDADESPAAKVRLGGIDFELPRELLSEMREIWIDIQSEAYGET